LLGLSFEIEYFRTKMKIYKPGKRSMGTKRTLDRVEVGLRHRVSVGHGRTEPPFRLSFAVR
jgi:hypothetical protein